MTYQEYLDGKKVIITVATTGGVHGKELNQNLPETPEEIARDVANCEAAGASIVHLHARRDNGERAYERERFQQLNNAVRRHTDDIIIQNTTGGTAVPVERRMESMHTSPPPEMASLDMGPLNRYAHLTSENTRATIETLATEMNDHGIKPELEVFNNGHLNETFRLLEENLLDDIPYINLIFGSGTVTPASPANLVNLVQQLPDKAEFNTLAFGRHQLPLTTMGLIMGGHIRVGMEDNIYYRQNQPVESNAQLVERAVRIAEELGRHVATSDEAREMLGL